MNALVYPAECERPETMRELKEKLQQGTPCEVHTRVAEYAVIALRGWLCFPSFSIFGPPNGGWVCFVPDDYNAHLSGGTPSAPSDCSQGD